MDHQGLTWAPLLYHLARLYGVPAVCQAVSCEQQAVCSLSCYLPPLFSGFWTRNRLSDLSVLCLTLQDVLRAPC